MTILASDVAVYISASVAGQHLAKDTQQPDIIKRFITLAHIRRCLPLTELAQMQELFFL